MGQETELFLSGTAEQINKSKKNLKHINKKFADLSGMDPMKKYSPQEAMTML